MLSDAEVILKDQKAMLRVGVVHKPLSYCQMLHQKIYEVPNASGNILQLMLFLWHGNIAIGMAEKFLPVGNLIQNILGMEQDWKRA